MLLFDINSRPSHTSVFGSFFFDSNIRFISSIKLILAIANLSEATSVNHNRIYRVLHNNRLTAAGTRSLNSVAHEYPNARRYTHLADL
jgi:hypothetical protein